MLVTMFASQLGINAVYRGQKADNQGNPYQYQQARPVVAFTDDGYPMIIGDPQDEQNKKLVRADVYEDYVGMEYNQVVFGAHTARHMELNGGQQGDACNFSTSLNKEDRDPPATVSLTEWEIAAVDLAALRVLELAGKRQLTNGPRGWRGQLGGVPEWEIHAQVPVRNPDKAIRGAYELLRSCLPGQEKTFKVIDEYVRERLATQRLHDTRILVRKLAEAGCIGRAR